MRPMPGSSAPQIARSGATRGWRWRKRLHARGEMVYGQFSRGSLLNLYHRRVKGAYWMQNYAIPVRSPINLVWLDPYWEER